MKQFIFPIKKSGVILVMVSMIVLICACVETQTQRWTKTNCTRQDLAKNRDDCMKEQGGVLSQQILFQRNLPAEKPLPFQVAVNIKGILLT